MNVTIYAEHLENHFTNLAHHYTSNPNDKEDQCGLLKEPFGEMTLEDVEQPNSLSSLLTLTLEDLFCREFLGVFYSLFALYHQTGLPPQTGN